MPSSVAKGDGAFMERGVRGGAGGRGSSGTGRRRWCPRKEISTSAIPLAQKTEQFISHGVVEESSPRRQPWDQSPNESSPGWGGRNVLRGVVFLSLLPELVRL